MKLTEEDIKREKEVLKILEKDKELNNLFNTNCHFNHFVRLFVIRKLSTEDILNIVAAFSIELGKTFIKKDDSMKIKYGDEKRYDKYGGMKDYPKQCPDCGVKKGEYHLPGCDVEECSLCGRQLISCDCEKE